MAPDLAGDAQTVLTELNELDLDSFEELEGDESSDTNNEANKKMARAFGTMRTALKTAKGVIKAQSEALHKGDAGASAKPSSQGQDASQQEQIYMEDLRTRAMRRLGVYDPNSELVKLEVHRLYEKDNDIAERTVIAEREASGIMDEVIGSFGQFDEADIATVRERMADRNAIDQANPDVIKAVAHTYIGENFEKFSGKSTGTPAKGKTSGGAGAGAVAASSVKSRGTKGVALGDSNSEESVKPATLEEMKRMRLIGISDPSPAQITMYRRAEAKKEGRNFRD
jgi:hypothetical protein